MSDAQIYYVLQQSEGKVCGRMNKNQLNRPLAGPTIQKSPDLLAVVLGLTLLMSVYPSYAQEENQAAQEISLIEQLNEDSTQIDLGHDYVQMRFQFVDENTGEPIPLIKARVIGEYGNFYVGGFSDFDGRVSFQLTPDQFDSADSLLVSSIDIGDVNLVWNKNWSKDKIEVIPLSSDELLIQGDMVVVGLIVTTENPGRSSRRYKREMRKMKRKEPRSKTD